AGNVDLSALPSKADLAKQQQLLAKQEKEAQAAKKKAEKDIAGLQARIAKTQKAIDAGGKELDGLNKQLNGLPADAPESKRAALQKKIDKANKTKEESEKQIVSL